MMERDKNMIKKESNINKMNVVVPEVGPWY